MVRSTRPGISRFRVRCFASPRNDVRVLNDAIAIVTTASAPVPQYLEHAGGGDDSTIIRLHFGVHEHETAGGADHARSGHQGLADLAGVDEMHIELNRR